MATLATTRLKTFTDEDLMELFQGGNEAAFNTLVSRFQDRLHNFLYRYTHNHQDCEDLVQETFLRVYRSKHTYERIAKLSTWIYTIALNLAKSFYHKQKRMQTVSIHKDERNPDDQPIDIEDSAILQDESLHEKMCINELERALDRLNEDFKEVVVLRDIQQLTYSEIVEITGLSMGTVKSRINRGRAKLQELLEHHVYPETISA